MSARPTDPPVLRFSQWILGAMVYLYPEDFRKEFGPAIREGYSELIRRAHRERGFVGLLVLHLLALRDTLETAGRERAAAWRAIGRRLIGAARRAEWSASALSRDARSGIRALGRQPALAASILALGTLGLSVLASVEGLRAGIRSDAARFRDAGSLVEFRRAGLGVGDRFSQPELDELRQASPSLLGLSGFHSMWFVLDDAGSPTRVEASVVGENFFELLGVEPLIGRQLTADRSVALLSYDFWTRRYDRDPRVLGETLPFTDRERTIIGVLPPIPTWSGTDVWVHESSCPFLAGGGSDERTERNLRAVGRVRPDSTTAALQRELDHLGWRWRRRHPQSYVGYEGPVVAPLRGAARQRAAILGEISTTSWLLLVAAALGAGLLTLARARWGDSRPRTGLVSELRAAATAGSLLGGMSAALALALAQRIGPRLAGGILAASYQSTAFRPGLFTAAATLAAGGLLGALLGLLSVGSRLGFRPRRLFPRLLTLQMAVAGLLLVGSAQALRHLNELEASEPSAAAESVVTAQLDLDYSRHDGTEGILGFRERVVDGLRERPEIRSAAFADSLPLHETPCGCQPLLFEGPAASRAGTAVASIRRVDPDYLGVVGSRILAGRNFDEGDRAGRPRVAILSERLARDHFGAESPIGRRVSINHGRDWYEIVGVATGESGPLPAGIEPSLYISFLQAPFFEVDLVVRAAGSPKQAARALRETVQAADPLQPVGGVETLSSAYHRTLAATRLRALVLAPAALLALLVTGWAAWTGAPSSARSRRARRRAALSNTAPARLRATAAALVPALLVAPWAHRLLLATTPTSLVSDAPAIGAAALLLAAVSAYGALAGAPRKPRGLRSRLAAGRSS